MERKAASSPLAARAVELVENLQTRFVGGLNTIAARYNDGPLSRIEWLRDDGRHGGGVRYAIAESAVFNRASVNVSSVHYDDMPDRRLASANALSAIIHPDHPAAPSFHTHISWTEMRDGRGYWRLMADLNPSIENPVHTALFEKRLGEAAPEHYDEARTQGDAYFYIPAAKRHRGVSHFYLEGHSTGDFDVDEGFARSFGERIIDTYLEILAEGAGAAPPSSRDRNEQIHYHSLYLLQVLTLDRGTTSGLLVHDQNDVGILGSLPAYVDRGQLAALIEAQPSPQDQLLQNIVDSLPEGSPSHVSDEVRGFLARVVRGHYETHPNALDLQASGGILPPTVANHQSKS